MKLTEPSGCVTPPTFPMPPIYGAGIIPPASPVQARAYQEGMHDAMALLVTALEEGGTVNHLLEVLEWNARPEDAKRLNDFYAAHENWRQS